MISFDSPEIHKPLNWERLFCKIQNSWLCTELWQDTVVASGKWTSEIDILMFAFLSLYIFVQRQYFLCR